MRFGILTGGGDCPGLNAVLMAATRAALADGGGKDQIIGFKDGFAGLIKNKTIELDLKIVEGLLARGGTILGSSNRDNPFAYAQREGGEIQTVDVSDRAIANYKANQLDALLVIGGDGTLDIAHRLSSRGINVVGIPKTIDNDLSSTDVTFGFDTAVNTVMEAIDKIQTTAESHHRIMCVEVMGRDAGWIAVAAGIAGGAHLILIPEIEFDYDSIARKIYQRKGEGKHFTVIVVAEGAKPIGGERVIKRTVEGAPETKRLGGIGDLLASELEAITNIEARCSVLGHIQRGGSPSGFDRVLSCRYGVMGIEFARAGKFGHMVALRATEVIAIPLAEALHKMKRVPLDKGHVLTARAIGISFGEPSE